MNKDEPLTVSIEHAAKVLGIGRTTAYAAARSGNLGGIPVIRIGARLLVPRAALDRVLEGAAPFDSSSGLDSRQSD